MKTLATKLLPGLGLALAGVQVKAVSLIDFSAGGLTGAATNIGDTASSAAAFVLPVIVGVAALLVGVRLLKRFIRSI